MDDSKDQGGTQQEFKDEIDTEKSAFAISKPMREEQVQNAVKFLSHPKVRDSPVIYRRSFLDKKGLTKEEIDEAFRRVPDPPSNATNAGATTKNQDIQARSSMVLEPQVTAQIQQSATVPPSALSVAPSLQQSRFRWSRAFLSVGILSASVAGTAFLFKSMIIHRLKAWIQKVVEEEGALKKNDKSRQSSADAAAKAAKEAASAVAVVVKVAQELLNAKNEEKRYFEALLSVIKSQVEEMKLMGSSIRALENSRETKPPQETRGEEYIQSKSWNTTTNSWGVPQVSQPNSTLSSTRLVKVNDTNSKDSHSVRTSSAPASMEPIMAPYSKSCMEIIEMVQRGEKPPNIRVIDDMPPDPNQPIRKPLLAPKPKVWTPDILHPWEVIQQQQQQQQGSSYVFKSPWNGQELNSNVREDNSKMNVIDSSEPQWRKKTMRITEVEPQIEETKQFSSAVLSNEHLNEGWVPLQPLMPEAADSIREPKSSLQKQQSGDESLIVCSNGEDYNLKASELVVSSESYGSVLMDLNPTELHKQDFGLEV
ncbi:peroxisomal membrane protein PEX14-like isoform X2 [Typha angustifolia]|uniref:peroxisomal membrane protein PEX14-like isoform X2 n=1 Tax=Typha angustifolia TaxID=59011 RepID=UPI003C2CD2F5